MNDKTIIMVLRVQYILVERYLAFNIEHILPNLGFNVSLLSKISSKDIQII